MKTLDGYFSNNVRDGYGIIYKATNRITEKCYIGQTIKRLKDRICRHYIDAKKHKYKFANALNKYQKDDWIWEIISNNIPYSELNIKEILFISQHNPEYNTAPGGKGGCRGDKSPSKRPEVRAKISKAHMGKKHSAGHKKKISKINSGNGNPMYGKKHTKDALRKMSKNNAMHRKECREKAGDTKSHWWLITFPDGHSEIIKNLRKFCRENYLSQGNMSAVAAGRKKTCKGFKCKQHINLLDNIYKYKLGDGNGTKI